MELRMMLRTWSSSMVGQASWPVPRARAPGRLISLFRLTMLGLTVRCSLSPPTPESMLICLVADVWCGYGKMGALGDISASTSNAILPFRATPGVKVAACWQAAPSTTYTVTPVVKFYIATGSFTAGEAVHIKAIGAKQTIDFTEEGNKTYASFSMNADGTYTDVHYSPTAPAVARSKK
jgi:hypothetical protein